MEPITAPFIEIFFELGSIQVCKYWGATCVHCDATLLQKELILIAERVMMQDCREASCDHIPSPWTYFEIIACNATYNLNSLVNRNISVEALDVASDNLGFVCSR